MTWNLDPPPGFRGLDPGNRVTLYQRHLPHWRQPGATYFVTFRLADSLPESRLRERYELGCSVVMPNHVHLIVRPFDEDDEALSRITHSLKRHTSRQINQILDLQGELWQDENFDRIVRDEEHLWRTVQYIGSNPGKAGLDAESCQLWLSPSWRNLGWTFTEE